MKRSSRLLAFLLLAPLAIAGAAEPRVLLPTAGEQAAIWSYTFDKPAETWTKPDFDSSSWKEGKAGFGVPDVVTPQASIGTPWKTSDIWLRRTIPVADTTFTTAALRVRHDDDVEVFVNGTLIFAEAGFNTEMTSHDVTESLRTAWKTGDNLLAAHVRQASGGQYFDAGLVLDPEDKPLAPAISPTRLRKLRDARWPADKAWKWYASVGPVCGFNYLPRTAVNTTEMWQHESFDPQTIDEELGWAKKCGLNSARVFVQFVVYEADPGGLLARMEKFLEVANRHSISVMFVLLDDCFLPEPKLGKQPDPVPGVHNSQWTSSPGERRKRRENWPALENYVKHVLRHFANDQRVLVWDLYNEPAARSRPLVEAAFSWARDINPSQPLTTCWQGMDLWDIGNYHDYSAPDVRRFVEWRAERPALCTECIARGAGSRFDNVLPAMAEAGVGWYMWGLVKGRTQTYYPWGSPKGSPEPTPWHHDLLQPNGKPYRPEEVVLIQSFPTQFKLPDKARGVDQHGQTPSQAPTE